MTGIGLTIAAVIGGAVLGQGPGAGTSSAVPKVGVPVAATEPAYSKTEQVPEELLGGPRRKVVILPREPADSADSTAWTESPDERSGAVVAKVVPEQHRLPEGYVIGARAGRIDKEDKWFIARLASGENLPDAPPLRLLPNRELAKVEAILTEVPGSRDFLLSGRITEFQGVNYLLLEHVAQVLPVPPEEKVSPEAKPASGPTTGKGAPSRAGREPTPEEVIQQLMQSEPDRVLVLPEVRTTSAPVGDKTESAGGEQIGWPEGTLLVDQVGRVVPGGEGWWLLAWEDRGENAGRKPVRLLPNRLLETAVALSGGGTRGVVFVLSGEVEEYKGVNYLLLRKVLIRRDLGNLR